MGCFASKNIKNTIQVVEQDESETVHFVTLPCVSLSLLNTLILACDSVDQHWDGLVDTLLEGPEFMQPKLVKKQSIKFWKAVEMAKNLDQLGS